MGMYTQIHFAAQLKAETPKPVLEVLQFMVGDADEQPAELPAHPLFQCPRWRFMLTCDSYYFDYKTTHLLKFDDISKSWFFNVTSNLNNYEDEISKFVDWIMPYCDKIPGDFLGYSRYEENQSIEPIHMRDSLDTMKAQA